MERKLLSNKLIFEKTITTIIIVALLILFIKNSMLLVGLPFITIVFAAFSIVVLLLPHRIEFDHNNIYVAKRSGNIIVDLKDVYIIKNTGFRFDFRSLWKIKYKVNGIEKAARFYPTTTSTLDEFIRLVTEKNQNIEITTKGVFDFDLW